MVEYDSNMIKPVDSLQNITGLAPTRRREQRRRRQQLDSEKEENKQFDETIEDKTQRESFDLTTDIDDDCNDSKIDYCA